MNEDGGSDQNLVVVRTTNGRITCGTECSMRGCQCMQHGQFDVAVTTTSLPSHSLPQKVIALLMAY